MLLYNFTLEYIELGKKQTHRERDQIYDYQRCAWRVGGEMGGDPKVQISSCKIKYQGYNVQHNDYTSHCSLIYRKAVKRIAPESSHHKGKHIFVLFFLPLFFIVSV